MIKKYFPGANSAQGFYSLYDYILMEPNLKIILKGGPGVGKSTIIKKIAKEMTEEGWEVEHHCCSSDNRSLDGAVINNQIAIIDGTAPHTVDPLHPGVVDEIINLGAYWDLKTLQRSKEEIVGLGEKINLHFKQAYLLLKEAGILKMHLREYYQKWHQENKERRILHSLKKEIFSGVEPSFAQRPIQRHLFASAITPEGVINHLHTLLPPLEKVYLLLDHLPGGGEIILKSLAQEAWERGTKTLILHCGLLPESFHHLIFEDEKKAVMTSTSLFKTPSLPKEIERIIPLYSCSENDFEGNDTIMETIGDFFKTIKKATIELKKSRDLHHQREKIYGEAMDFQGVDICTQKTQERIQSSLGLY